MNSIRKLLKVILLICVIIIGISAFREYQKELYINETKNMSEEDLYIVNKVIDLAKEKVGLQYVWGGKGEIMSDERLNQLINAYGSHYYPLKRSDYIGKQAFDCSGLTYWTYNQITGIEIGYSTIEQQDILKNYKVDYENIQPGDLIFHPGHVVMYIGKGKIINSANQNPYPIGGVKENYLFFYKGGDVYRPMDYINDQKSFKRDGLK